MLSQELDDVPPIHVTRCLSIHSEANAVGTPSVWVNPKSARKCCRLGNRGPMNAASIGLRYRTHPDSKLNFWVD